MSTLTEAAAASSTSHFSTYIPNRGSIYSLKVDADNIPNVNSYSLYYDKGTIYGNSDGYNQSRYYNWQLMPIGEKSFIICSQASGLVVTIVQEGSIQNVTVGEVDDNTPLINAIQVGTKIALYVPAYNAYIVCGAQDGSVGFLQLKTFPQVSDAAVFTIVERDTITVPALPVVESMNVPVFNNGIAPAYSGLSMGRSSYIPYCMVIDKTLTDPSDAVINSPYYLLQQYVQYQLAACINNDTDGEHIFVEDWQFGTSQSKSDSFTQQIGTSLNFSLEENEYFLKEDESVNASGNLGFEEGNTTSFSATGSKEIRMQVPARKSVALYGILSSYKLYQMSSIRDVAAGDDVQSVAQIDKYARMASKFLTISNPIN